MSQNQNYQQQPPPNPVPDHRLNEIQEQLRKLADENQQLKGTINALTLRQNPQNQQQAPQPDPEDAIFRPEVSRAIENKVKKLLGQEAQGVRNAFNNLAEQNDELRFRQRWGSETYDKNREKIERIRQESLQQRGQWLDRESAYKFVAFEENQRKPQPKPDPAQNVGPSYDPYTGQVIQPQQQAAPLPQQVPIVPQQMGQQTPYQNQQAPPPAQPYPQANYQPNPPPQQTNPQYQQPPPDDFGLPPVGPVTQGTPPAQGQVPMTGFDVTADEKALDAWANKFADVVIP